MQANSQGLRNMKRTGLTLRVSIAAILCVSSSLLILANLKPSRLSATRHLHNRKEVAVTDLDPQAAHDMLLSKGWKLVSKSGEVATDPEGYDQELFALADGRVYSRRLATQPEASGLGDRGNHQEPSEDITTNRPGTSRVLLGSNDNRFAITNPETIRTYPLRTIGAVSETETGRTGCTATLVGPRHAITAAHCVQEANGSQFIWPWFNPAQRGNDDSYNLKQKSEAVYARTWANEWDYGLLVLPDNLQLASLGWMGRFWYGDLDNYENIQVQVAGYPGFGQQCANSPRADGACGGFMYSDLCKIDTATNGYIMYDCDATGGQSGSAVFRWSPGQPPVVLGVHKRGNEPGSGAVKTSSPPTLNLGPRMRSRMNQDICTWIGDNPSVFADHPCY